MSNLAVKVTADIVDLQTKFAVAKAEVQGLTSEMNKLARASATGTIDSAGTARLQQLSASLITARQAAGGYASELTKAGISLSGFASASEGLSHGSISTATREFRALFDELSSGRTRMTPGTLAIIASRVFGLGPAALGAVAGVAALTAGLGYLVYRAVEAGKALDSMELGAQFAGNLTLGRQQIAQFVDQMAQARNISTSDARTIGASFASIPGLATQTFGALSQLIGSFAQQSGQNATKAGEQLAKMFAPGTTAEAAAEQLAKLSANITQVQLNQAQAADAGGNAYQVQAEKLQLLTAAMGPAVDTMNKQNAGIFASIKNYALYSSMEQQGIAPEEARSQLLSMQTERWQAASTAVTRYVQQLRSMPAPTNNTLQLGVQVANKENPLSLQIQDADTKIQQMTAALAVAKQQGDQLDVKLLTDGLAKANQELQELQNKGDLAGIREQIEAEKELGETVQKEAEDEIRVADQTLDAIAEAQRQAQEQARQIGQQDAEATIQLSRMKLEAEKDSLNNQVTATDAAANQKYARLKQLTEQEYALDLQQLQDELATLKDQPVEYDRVYNQIRELKQRNILDLEQLDKEQSQATAKEVRQQISLWKTSVDEIESAESGMVSDLLMKRKTLSQSLEQMSAQLVTKEIENDVRAMTTRLLLANTAQTQQKAMEQGGYLYHLLFSQQATAATVTSQTAQTQAVVAGSVARNTAQTGAAAQSAAVQGALGAKSVMADAAKAFSGTYASVSSIPVVGWVLAPVAAAGAFAAVAAYEGLASLDVGAWNVPQDMVAQIHKGESVVPTTFAQGMRQSGFGGDDGGGGGDTYHLHMGGSMDSKSFDRYISQPANRQSVAKAMRTHFGR